MITIKQLAELASVSPTTVSNVLHGRYNKISKEKLDLVQQLIQESNYVSNMGGRLLGNYGSKIIAVIISYKGKGDQAALEDPFAGTIVGAIEREITSNGYFLMLYHNENVEECLNMARAWNVEGIILLGFTAKQYLTFNSHVEVPVVTIDTDFRCINSKYLNVGLQDYEGGCIMAKYLLNCGHRRIAYLAFDGEVSCIDDQRKQGMMDTLKLAGISATTKDYIRLSEDYKIRLNYLKILANNNFREYTALFFSSDSLAIEAMNLFFDLGYQIPDDISIVGFDDIRAASQCRPKLTTIHQDIIEKGRISVHALIEIIETKEFRQKNILLPTEIVIRDSVKNLLI